MNYLLHIIYLKRQIISINMFEDIDWYNGLLIKPQHMQTMKLTNYFKILNLNYMWDQNFYGLINYTVDFDKLHEGIINVINVYALQKDGSLIDYDIHVDDYKLIYELNNDPKLDNNIDSIYLYLSTLNYNPKTTCNKSRYYKQSYGPIIDEAQSDYDETMQVLKVRPILLFEKDILPKHSVIPFIKLKRNKGIWQHIDYHPPYFFLKHNNIFIIDSCNILNQLSKKLSELSLRIIHNKQYQTLDHKVIIDIHNYEIINPQYLRLKHILSNNHIRPYNLFIILSDLLSTIEFSMCKISNVEMKYSHNNMHQCISIIINKINVILVDALKQNIIFINFEDDEISGQISISIPREYKIINNFLYCFCNTEMDYEATVKLIDNLVIYSDSKQEEIKQMRIRGIKREVIKNFANMKDLVGLSGIDGSICFRMSIDDPYFDYDDRLVIELDAILAKKMKFNIILKQN